MSKSKDMQVALLAPTTSEVLTMPHALFVETYVQPVEDDTWIRHADIVHMDQLVETDAAALQAKRDVLREYMEDHTRQQRHRNGTATAQPDAVLEGILWQENFIQEYRAREHQHDADVASRYRSSLVKQFRQRRPSQPRRAPFGEEESDDDVPPPPPAAAAAADDAAAPANATQEAAAKGTAAEETTAKYEQAAKKTTDEEVAAPAAAAQEQHDEEQATSDDAAQAATAEL